jgi:hypothetical protein
LPANQAGGCGLFSMGKIVLIAALFALLAGSIWFAVQGWMSLEGTAIPTEGYVAMALGIFFTLVVGVGLMMLMFYSHRRGYDEPAQRIDLDRD